MEVCPQGLALGLELIDDLRLDRAQGLVGKNDAGLALNSSLDAGKEAINIIGSGLARDAAADQSIGDLARLIDHGNGLAFLHVQSNIPDDLAGRLVVAGEFHAHIIDLDHGVDSVLDLLELCSRQEVVFAVDLINGADDGALHLGESGVHLIDGVGNSLADMVLGIDLRFGRAGTATAAAATGGIRRLGVLNEVGHAVDHRCHVRAGRKRVRTERTILEAVDQAVTLALLDGVNRVGRNCVLVRHSGDRTGLGQRHLVALLIVVEVTVDNRTHLRTGDGCVRGKRTVSLAFHDLVGSRPVDRGGAPCAGRHIRERTLAAVALRTVETGQDHDEHRTGHIPLGREGRFRSTAEITLRRYIVYIIVEPVGSADVREIVSLCRQRCGHQGKDDAQCQQSTQDTLLFHLSNHSFFF